jgi:hypothetical protein
MAVGFDQADFSLSAQDSTYQCGPRGLVRLGRKGLQTPQEGINFQFLLAAREPKKHRLNLCLGICSRARKARRLA